MIPDSWIDEVERRFQWGQPNDDPAVYRELFIRLIREHNELEARVELLERARDGYGG